MISPFNRVNETTNSFLASRACKWYRDHVLCKVVPVETSHVKHYKVRNIRLPHNTFLFSGPSWSLSLSLDLQLPMQSVPITPKVVSSNPEHGDVYCIQHYAIKVAIDLRQVGGFRRVFWFPTPVNLTATI